ncbi:hypothetical protein HY285_00795 [Candidatus Peregrinibacteria bacterium]|nr:hypothetical protein [Candidatus Peregrinibacteria bacterium]MBI3816067.1 hypothetical protein [Candidatus Peregrinibacteria bacterium]
MKKFFSILFVALMLAACSKNVSMVRYHITIVPANDPHGPLLIEAAQRVINRRVGAMNAKVLQAQTKVSAEQTTFAETLSDPTLNAKLTQQLQGPFSFRLMRKIDKGETPDLTTPAGDGFVETGVTEKDVEWIAAGSDPGTSTGNVDIAFTSGGQQKLKTLFLQTKGKLLGLFLRGHLVSMVTSTGDAKTSIAITGIPSAILAGIFADDVNVGVHVQFIPAG